MSDTSKNAKTEQQFLRLKSLADRLENFGEAMTLVTNTDKVVAGEALVALAVGKLAGEVLFNAARSMGFNVATLRNPLPGKPEDLQKAVAAIAGLAQSVAKLTMKSFNCNQDAALEYLPVTVDELSDICEEMLNRADKHYKAALRANAKSVPQADGDDGQVTDNK